jgi:hypothetical protein
MHGQDILSQELIYEIVWVVKLVSQEQNMQTKSTFWYVSKRKYVFIKCNITLSLSFWKYREKELGAK